MIFQLLFKYISLYVLNDIMTKKNININTEKVKIHIIKFFLEKIDIDKCSFNSIKTYDDLTLIKNNNYSISPLKNGKKIWLLFYKYVNEFYAVYIHKNELTTYLNTKNIKNINFYPINVKVRTSLYNGSIFEGFLTIANKINNLYINNIYVLKGNVILNIDRFSLNEQMKELIETDIQNYNNEKIIMNDCFELNENDIKKLKMRTLNEDNINGWLFIPNELNDINKMFIYKIDKNDLFNIENQNSDDNNIFVMKKTIIPDVYELHKNSKKLCNAYIPDMKTSNMCKRWFENDIENINVKCIKHKNGKWVPFEISG